MVVLSVACFLKVWLRVMKAKKTAEAHSRSAEMTDCPVGTFKEVLAMNDACSPSPFLSTFGLIAPFPSLLKRKGQRQT